MFQKLVTLLGPNLISMFIAFGLLYWVTMSRIIRGQILQLKQQEYVTAARALGAKGGRIMVSICFRTVSDRLSPQHSCRFRQQSSWNLSYLFWVWVYLHR